MKKWYDEEYSFEIKVTGYLRGDKPEHLCRNGEEVGDTYTCTYGSPVNQQGYGICPKLMQIMYADMQCVRSGGSLQLVGGNSPMEKDYVCPDGCVLFHLKATKTGRENFYEGGYFKDQSPE